MSKNSNTELNERSKQVRRETLKLSKANGGYHYGGCFSVTEILIALYDKILKDNDKFILSKGHACWPYYVLLRERGLNPKLEGHPCLDEKNGVYCTIDSVRPNRHQGSKEERIAAVLEPRYDDMKMYHFKGGYTPALEEELVLARPKHDDLKDCLASVVEIAIPPKVRGSDRDRKQKVQFNSRFGGVVYRG